MGKRTLFLSLVTFGLANLNLSFADGLPDKQPQLLHIWRESVKPGRAAEHAKNEAGFVAALEKAKAAGYGLALISETGPDEAWYLTTWNSNAAMGEDRKRLDKDAAASAELARLDRIDAEFLTGVKKMLARGRSDLSIGQFPDLAKARFFEITTYRLRPGRQDQFQDAAKAYAAAVKRAGTKTSARVYELIAGAPTPTFLVFMSVEDYGQFDQLSADMKSIWGAANAEEKAAITSLMKEAVLEEETNRFRLDPVQSYVPKETREKDPEFWSAK